MRRPNFLFIITDQQRADYLGCYGHPVLKTPNIDSLAERGVRFNRCYVNTPICMPNRASLMTGRMPSAHGVRHNGIPLDPDSNTFVHLLREAGYRTALVGKSHLQTMVGKPPLMGRKVRKSGHLQPRDEFEDAHLKGYYDARIMQERPQFWEKPDARISLPFYGFDHVDLVTYHGDMAGGEYLHWLGRKGIDIDKLRGPDNSLPHEYRCPQAWRTAVPEDYYSTSYIVEKSLEYLDRASEMENEDPFFLKISFPDPHHPFTPPGKYWDLYRPEEMPLPLSFNPGEGYNPPPTVQHCHEHQAKANRNGMMAFSVDEQEAREAMALSCGMIAMIDDAVGKILERLKFHEMERDTVVIFTSDHGDFLGDHRLLLKGPIHYQSVIRVPLIWCDPDRADRSRCSDALVSTMDITASLLDRAGVEPFHGMQGKSFIPSLDGALASNSLLIEEDGQRPLYGFDVPPRLRTLITDRYRLTLYDGAGWGEIYDLQEDPFELYNLWSDIDVASVKCQLLEELARKQMEMTDRSPLPFEQA